MTVRWSSPRTASALREPPIRVKGWAGTTRVTLRIVRARAAQTRCRYRGAMRATPQAPEEIHADQNARKKGQRRQGECSAEAAPAVGGAGRGGGLGARAPGPGGEQDLGLHPLAQPAEPGEPPRDPRRRQAPEGLWQR